MSILDYILIALVVLMAVWGFRRGLLSGLIGTAKYAVGVPVSLFVSHQYYQAVYDNLVEQRPLPRCRRKSPAPPA